MDDQRRWMTSAQAAVYCGIGDKGYFLKLAKVYHLPRYGHSRRMFDRIDLDTWMIDPKCFLPDYQAHARRRKAGSFTPIHNLIDLTPGIDEPETPEENALPTRDELREMLAIRREQAVVKLHGGAE